MMDIILTARLDTLERNLNRVEQFASWLASSWLRSVRQDGSDPAEEQDLRLPYGLWAALDAKIGRQARNQKNALHAIREKLRQVEGKDDAEVRQYLEEAWRSYAAVYEQSQQIFGECLEFIGGLAFRDKGLDERIYQVADELIRICAEETTGQQWQSLTVPTMQETLTATLTQIIRLRFPEWTIWSLPFTAHEFGHMLAREDSELQSFVNDQVEKWLKQEHELQHLLQDNTAAGQTKEWAKERARKRADYHVNEFLADAFATYTMGPAYAYAAILLRFNPSVPYVGGHEYPDDAQRAHVVFSMLKRLDKEAGRSPYKQVIEVLEKEWTAVLNRTRPAGVLDPADEQRLEELVNASWDKFLNMFRPTARYPHAGAEGWRVAQDWEATWREQLKRGQKLSIQVSATSKLRDALNAAWLWRIYEPEQIKEITDAAQQLCQAIVEERNKHSAPRVPTISSGGRG